MIRHLGSAAEKTEINAKSRQNAYAMRKYLYVSFCNLMNKTGKMQNYVKKVGFWPHLYDICCCHGNIKKSLTWMDCYRKFEPLRVNCLRSLSWTIDQEKANCLCMNLVLWLFAYSFLRLFRLSNTPLDTNLTAFKYKCLRQVINKNVSK